MSNANGEMGPVQRLQETSSGRHGGDFQDNVLEKLARLEAKVDVIFGNGQPGRMKFAEDRLVALEKNDLRRTVYDRLITAGITFAISGLIAWHDHLGLK